MAIDPRRSHLPCISNGIVELAVDPAIGRVMHFGRVGGPNLLWTNPRAQECASPFHGWINYGGDKVWLWPESDWKLWHGVHAPPGDPPTEPHRIEVLSKRSLRVISPEIEACGMRIAREITLDAESAGATLVNRLEKVSHTKLQKPVGIWTVTQLPATREIFARFVSDARDPKFASFEHGTWPAIRADSSIAVLERPREAWAKIGLEADVLATTVGSELFSIFSGANFPSASYAPHCRAQVFSDPDRSQFRVDGVGPYIEFEFTSPVRKLDPGDAIELLQRWTLSPVSTYPLNAFITHIDSR